VAAEVAPVLNDVLVAAPFHFIAQENESGVDLRLLQKRDKVAALDLRFQRYRKAEP
jgi:hypothetical protein